MIHDELIADFKAIQNKIDAHAKAESEAKPARPVRSILIHQVRGKCDGAIAILQNDVKNAAGEAKAAPAPAPETKPAKS